RTGPVGGFRKPSHLVGELAEIEERGRTRVLIQDWNTGFARGELLGNDPPSEEVGDRLPAQLAHAEERAFAARVTHPPAGSAALRLGSEPGKRAGRGRERSLEATAVADGRERHHLERLEGAAPAPIEEAEVDQRAEVHARRERHGGDRA